MEDAQLNANLALEKAIQADDLARNSSERTKQIKSEAEDLRQNTTFLSDEAGLMFDRVLNTEAELKNLLEKSRSNSTLVHDAKEKVMYSRFCLFDYIIFWFRLAELAKTLKQLKLE